jgi:hypothetical protein
MAGREARIFAEGLLRWAVASGNQGAVWVTASAGATGLIGFVQAGTNFNRQRTVATIMERGVPNHLKNASQASVPITFTFLQSVTANYPPTSTTAAAASLPLVNFELKHGVPELGGATAQYHQFLQCAFVGDNFTEAEQGNTYQQTWQALFVQGPTASGYLATGSV